MSFRIAGGVEDLSIPAKLRPKTSDQMLPALDAQDLAQVKRAGWQRVGIVAAVVDERQRLLILTHKPSDKTPKGALGPLAETAQVAHRNGRIRVESTAHTLSRAIFEELGVARPGSLALTAKRLGAWAINDWPVGINHRNQRALAVCPVVHIGKEKREMLQDTFSETPEITSIDFVSPADVARARLVRPGTHDWLKDVMASGLIGGSPADHRPVDLPRPHPLPGAVDIKFGSIDFL